MRVKGTLGSRLRMKAVRKGSKDQEIFRWKMSTQCLFFSEVKMEETFCACLTNLGKLKQAAQDCMQLNI